MDQPGYDRDGGSLDKNLDRLRQHRGEPFYGNCYTRVRCDNGAGNAVKMATSSNGGASWTVHSTSATGLGGQPVRTAQRDRAGAVREQQRPDPLVPVHQRGSTWNSSVLIATIQDHAVAGSLRTEPLPSARSTRPGPAYVVWQTAASSPAVPRTTS